MSEKLSAIIITLNEEKNIARCLEAVSQVADEIIIVDSYSMDNTQAICEQFETKFFQNKFVGYIEQKDYAKSLATYDLVLSVDADEVLSNELISSIQKVKADRKFDAYSLNRLSYYVDRFIYHGHWFPDRKIRLFDKNCGQWGGRNPHDQFIPDKAIKVANLDGEVYHYTFNSIAEHMNQANKFSEIGAMGLSESRLFYLVIKALISPIWGFLYGYVLRLGFLDGWYGLIIAIISSVETFLKYGKAITKKYAKQIVSRFKETDSSISLIISTYNWPEALNQTLISVKNQYLLPNEVIIADDGSGEETRQLIEKHKGDFPVPIVHSWIEDKGFRLAKSRNEALKIAKYDYIVQVDGDLFLNKYFIKDHAEFARENCFVRGSRVLLDQKATSSLFSGKIKVPNVLRTGTTNFFNGVRIPLLRNILARKSKSIAGIRGCNMGYWKKDALFVNGYNEQIEGWGREDSEFIARLINHGLYKLNMRLGAVQFHIYHKEYDRTLLNKNDSILKTTMENKIIVCDNGIVNKNEDKLASVV